MKIINVENVSLFYYVSNLHKLSGLAKVCCSYIDRCFTTFAETHGFLELDFLSVAKILSSSQLHSTSEIEVFNAGDAWVSHKIKDRKKFAEDILLKVRLPLLSNDALKYVLNESSSFYCSDKCVAVIKRFLENRNIFNLCKPCSYFESRYCNQMLFDLIVCGGSNLKNSSEVFRNVYKIKANDLKNVEALPQINEARQVYKVVHVKNEIYLFGGRDAEMGLVFSVEKYSKFTNTWDKVAKMYDGRRHFCVCSIVDKIYIIGGSDENYRIFTNSCLEFDTKSTKWKIATGMNTERDIAACAVFEGRIVVSGGATFSVELDSVEAYDHVANAWFDMPNMVESRSCHKSVAIKHKLFVIGGASTITCEVYDSICETFVLLKQPSPASLEHLLEINNDVISLGNNVVVFGNKIPEDDVNKTRTLTYNVDKEEWSEGSHDTMRDLTHFSLVKVPQL